MLKGAKMAAPTGLILYYHPYSFYAQKVVMTLHEKELNFEPIVINLIKGEQYSSTFLKINPRGEVPVLLDNGKIIPDSARIIDYLEDNFSNGSVRLIPLGKNLDVRAKVEKYRQMIDPLPAGAITMGSFFHSELCGQQKMPFIKPIRMKFKDAEINSANNLRLHAELNPDAKSVLLKKAENQDKKHQLITTKEEYKKILDSVAEVLEKVESELANHDEEGMWLCSKEYSIADISLTILLVRLDALGLDSYFWTNGKSKYIEKYYRRVQKRDSFKKTIPSFNQHMAILIGSQTPLSIGIGIIGAIGIVTTVAILFKKIIV
ncbi:ganglioside induced differentiation associated protein 1 [Arctopsyche grandis]|uniref:ganglioside induced differentiation associated protein 1 n=1 Tax=Arctopsyche grandis TaxID=121162 RepID=UPI00406D745A